MRLSMWFWLLAVALFFGGWACSGTSDGDAPPSNATDGPGSSDPQSSDPSDTNLPSRDPSSSDPQSSDPKGSAPQSTDDTPPGSDSGTPTDTTGADTDNNGTDETVSFRKDYQPKSAPPVLTGGTTPPALTGSPVTVIVHSDQVRRRIPPTITGNNIAVWVSSSFRDAPAFMERLKAVSVGLLRFPGGSTSDEYHFDGNFPDPVKHRENLMANWAMSSAEYITLIKELGSIPLVAVNHGYAMYGTLAEATALAADWVEYFNAPNDGSNPNGGIDWAARRAADGHPEPVGVQYWEIGNEVYGTWETGHSFDGTTYAQNAIAFAAAMRAVDPSIHIGVAASPVDDERIDSSVDPRKTYRDWTVEVLSTPGLADAIDFLDVHNYFKWVSSPSSITADKVLDLTSQVAEYRADFDRLLSEHTHRGRDVGLLLGEFNTTHPDNPHTVSLVSGLFIPKVLGELLTHDFDAACLWNIANGWDEDAEGDHGFLSRNNDNPGVADHTPHPSYYAYHFYGRNFGSELVQSASSDGQVFAYASRFAGGENGLVLINHSDAPRQVTVALEARAAAGAVNAWILTGDSLTSRKVSLNGITTTEVAGGPILSDVPAYTWEAPTDGPLVIDLPKFSVGSLVIY